MILAVARLAAPDAGPEVGRPAPPIEGTTLDGQQLKLADFRGRPVVVNFWGPSCEPCRREFPLLKAKLEEHAADRLVVLGVLTGDPPEPARDFVAEFGAPWPTVEDPGGATRDAYRVVVRPMSFFVDRDGILRSIQIGEVGDAEFERRYAAIRP